MELGLKSKIRNYKYDDFDMDELRKTKKSKNLDVAIALPVYNEEETLEELIENIRSRCSGLFDNITVFDSGSIDRSEEICKRTNIGFISDKEFAVELGLDSEKWKSGKGFNLWASVYKLRGYDIICWIDTDLKLEPRFIYGILGPLIMEDNVLFAKGRYFREETDNRVTRILVEPIMSILFPETRDFVDPLCGLFGGKTKFLKKLPFYSGYSVDSATLIHALDLTAPENIAQVYLGGLKNRERDNKSLGRMSASIAYTIFDIADKRGILKLDKNKLSPSVIQQSTTDGIEFDFVKMDIEDYELPPVEYIEKAMNENRIKVESALYVPTR